jgi:hypothetical protein
VRGLAFRPREPAQVSPSELLRIDACWALARGLASHDVLRAQYFHTEGLLRALDCGEPHRAARTLLFHTLQLSTGGKRAQAKLEAVFARTAALIAGWNDPHLEALDSLMRTHWRYIGLCDWDIADGLASSEQQFRTRCSNTAWESGLCMNSRAHCLYWLGRWRELATAAPTMAAEAEQRGYHYVSANVEGQAMSFVDLLRDDVARARERIASVRGTTTPSPVQEFFHHSWLLRADLAAVDVDAALARADGFEIGFMGGLVLRAPIMRFVQLHDHMTVSLAALRAGKGGARALRRRVRGAAKSLDHEDYLCGPAFCALGMAALASLDGDGAGALRLLQAAETGFAGLEMNAHVAAVKARRGQLEAGAAGLARLHEALAWFQAEGSVRPESMVEMLAPGFPRL